MSRSLNLGAGRRRCSAPGCGAAGSCGVLSSPLSRARETCRLAGLAGPAEVTDDLVEWDYGAYEGRRTADPPGAAGWSIWRDGVPGARALRTSALVPIGSWPGCGGWVGRSSCSAMPISSGCSRRAGWPDRRHGRLFALAPATISILGYEREQPVMVRWNDRCHLVLPSHVWAEHGDLDVRHGDPSVGSGDDREGPG